jgi:hypothetical protein
LQYQQQQSREGEDNVDFVERVFFAAVKRATGAREQVVTPRPMMMDMSAAMNSKLLIRF